ncbi:MAG: ABC transporter ATP-binding protein [Rhodothermales bacterium]
MHTPEQDFTPKTEEVETQPFIRLRRVSKFYPIGETGVMALRDVDLDLPANRFTAVVGRSGSGKSTLLHVLAAMDTPTTGDIIVGSWHLSRLTPKEQARYRREMVGMIFQQFNLIPSMTALDNVALPLVLAGVSLDERRARARVCLEAVDLAHRLGHRPTELSGGEQQRVAIARALVHNPPLLLADEPTGNVDSTTSAQIIDLLGRVCREQGKSVILVTHHLDEVEHVAERVLTLHDGHLQDGEGV